MHARELFLVKQATIEEQMQPPVQYSWWVWAVGVALLALIVLWYLWVAWWTRRRPEPPPQPEREIDLTAVDAKRAGYLAEIDAAHAAFRAGEKDLRALYLDLNRIIRDFATVRTGVDAKPLTASELSRLSKGELLAGVVALQNVPAFAKRSGPDVDASVAKAKEIIGSW